MERKDVLVNWGDALPGLPLNYFADQLPAAYLRDQTGMNHADFPVLRRCEVQAKIRRGCFAGAVSILRDLIAGSAPDSDAAIPGGRESEYEGGWLGWQLPAAFRARYDRDFHRHMLALATSLWERMEDGTFTVPWCTAEELLLGIILSDYARRLESVELKPGIVDLDELWLEDDDYLLLYNIEIAERDDVLMALQSQIDTANLDFAWWFKPFEKSYRIPEPTSEFVLRRILGLPLLRNIPNTTDQDPAK